MGIEYKIQNLFACLDDMILYRIVYRNVIGDILMAKFKDATHNLFGGIKNGMGH